METDTDIGEENQKHDQGYKSILSNKDAFLHFVTKYAGVPWTNGLSVDDIEQVNTTYITKEYGHIDSDIIYKLKLNGKDVYFYVLLELQSTVDYTMPFRVLRYMIELLNDIFKNTDEKVRERKDFRLPAIVPIVLYNGSDNWTAAKSYREYTDNSDIFGDNIIDFRYLLFDLKRAGEEETILSTGKLLDIVFALDRQSRKNRDMAEITDRLSDLTNKLTDDDILTLIGWIKYVYFKGNVTPEQEIKLNNILKKGVKNTMKHGIEILMEEKEQEWLSTGEARGSKNKALEMAKTLKNKGVDLSTIVEASGLSVDEVLSL